MSIVIFLVILLSMVLIHQIANLQLRRDGQIHQLRMRRTRIGFDYKVPLSPNGIHVVFVCGCKFDIWYEHAA